MIRLEVAGHVVADPVARWRSYAADHAATLRDYDFQPPGVPDVLTAAEAYRSRVINSRMTQAESRELAQQAAGAPWEDIPAAADLADADPGSADGLFAGMARFYWHFTWPEPVRGVRVVKVHKALHPKRSALYPILDRNLKALYEPFARDWLSLLSYLGHLGIADSPPYWAAIRRDLVQGHDALEHGRIQLAADHDPAAASMAGLTRLRLLDIIAWTLVSGSGYPAAGIPAATAPG